MNKISTDLIKNTVYELCYKANICLNKEIYSKIYNAYCLTDNLEEKNRLKYILKNAKIAYSKKLPLCQDTGQVLVFLEIGQNVFLDGEFIDDAINSGVKEAYEKNFFRKSVVKNSLFDRTNTTTNTPCIIYTKYKKGDDVNISVLIKGGGSENKSRLEMMLPTSSEKEIVQKAAEIIVSSGINACPPMFVGIGIGGTCDKALLTSKEALLQNNFTEQEKNIAKEIITEVNKKAPETYKNTFVLDVYIKTFPTHIACMPLAITINCHSDRYSSAIIKKDEVVFYHSIPDFKDLSENNSELKELNADNIAELQNLKEGENIFLSGEIYVARDMAHKRLDELIKQNKTLPFNCENKIIFYAGPCPNSPDKIIGSIGPTTSGRMDKYAKILYKNGIFATIGKGDRSKELEQYIKENKKRYFTIQGGIAALLAQKVKKAEVIAFSELGTEAIYKIVVDKLPVKVNI